ncbi:competence type IV pilus major pilin ComGC [Amphibacillus indicireducens]|uniref:Competence type IV pilus major pilin ComGC n=1 Tax=Amphibacillus indicireducens TaxID=1076330 RepID=A0ABP7VG00_9BACI
MIKEENGFTLIEMLIVLAVITLLLILVVPNLADQNENINKNSEETLIKMAENQTQVYYIEKGRKPSSIKQLVEEGYLSTDEIANGQRILIYVDGDPDHIDFIDNEN